MFRIVIFCFVLLPTLMLFPGTERFVHAQSCVGSCAESLSNYDAWLQTQNPPSTAVQPRSTKRSTVPDYNSDLTYKPAINKGLNTRTLEIQRSLDRIHKTPLSGKIYK